MVVLAVTCNIWEKILPTKQYFPPDTIPSKLLKPGLVNLLKPFGETNRAPKYDPWDFHTIFNPAKDTLASAKFTLRSLSPSFHK